MRRTLFVLALVLALLSGASSAQETATLSSSIVKTTTTQQVTYVGFDLVNLRISVELTSNLGEKSLKHYDGNTTPTGATLLHNLNIGNFSGATSLIKAVYNRLIADGVLTGTVSGVPQD